MPLIASNISAHVWCIHFITVKHNMYNCFELYVILRWAELLVQSEIITFRISQESYSCNHKLLFSSLYIAIYYLYYNSSITLTKLITYYFCRHIRLKPTKLILANGHRTWAFEYQMLKKYVYVILTKTGYTEPKFVIHMICNNVDLQ